MTTNHMNEDLETSYAVNIAGTDQQIPLQDAYQQVKLPSLGRSIFQTVQMTGPSASIFAVTYEDDDKPGFDEKLKLVKGNIECQPSKAINSGISREALFDLSSTYGNAQALKYISKLLRTQANGQENDATLKLLKDNAVDTGSLQLSDLKNSETRMFEITNKVATCVLQMNTLSKRTFSSFAVIPYKYVSSIMTTYAYTTGLDTTNSNELLVANIALTKYYVNPDKDDTNVYVGLRGNNDFSGSAFFGKFADYLAYVSDPDTGNDTIFLFNRFAVAMNPLHSKENPMLLKFQISE